MYFKTSSESTVFVILRSPTSFFIFSNLVQEAKNGKGKSKVYVNGKNEVLSEKMNNLEGYVVPFSLENDAVDIIIDENPEIC